MRRLIVRGPGLRGPAGRDGVSIPGDAATFIRFVDYSTAGESRGGSTGRVEWTWTGADEDFVAPTNAVDGDKVFGPGVITEPEEPEGPEEPTGRTDTFNRADTTTAGLGTPSDGGSAWIPTFGTDSEASALLHIVGNKATASAFANPGSRVTFEGAVLECGSANGTVAVTLGGTPGAGSGDGTIGLLLRYVDESNFVIATGNIFFNGIDVTKYVGGTATVVASLNGSGFTHTGILSCVMAGDSFQFKFDGTNVGAAQTIAGFAGTKHGLVSIKPNFNADAWGFTA